MTLLELEHAAVIPSLWRSIGSANKPLPVGDDHPYRTKRILRGPTSYSIDGITAWGDTLFDLFLVPGGRYLILFFDDLMSVYDLGNTPDALLDCNTRLLASVEIQFKWLFLVNPSPDGSALRICVSDELAEDEDEQIGQSEQWVMSCNFSHAAQFKFIQIRLYNLQVYEIYPHHDRPQLELLSHWMLLGSSTQLCSIHLNRIVFIRDDILTVWDFVADTSATWRVAGEFHQVRSMLCYVIPHILISFMYCRSSSPTTRLFYLGVHAFPYGTYQLFCLVIVNLPPCHMWMSPLTHFSKSIILNACPPLTMPCTQNL